MKTVNKTTRVRVEQLTPRNLTSIIASLRPEPGIDRALKNHVEQIVQNVAAFGTEALIKYTERFDGVRLKPGELRVTPGEIEKAVAHVSRKEMAALKLTKAHIEKVEKQTLRRLAWSLETQSGVKVESSYRPLKSVGCYVPGGRAVYPSSVLMNVVPACVAGVERIVICSPPGPSKAVHPLILVAARLCGVTEIYRVGGAQAIAALAYGTEMIEPVQKIVGPGSAYVATAKLAVTNRVAIDLPAGPSELLIIADETAKARYIVMDLISQAEHGEDSIVGVVTTSKQLAKEIVAFLPKALNGAERSEIVSQSLTSNGFVLICDSIEQAIEFTNQFAPEHLEIMARGAKSIARRITAAGLILLGGYSPVPASDYLVGTNHVLPTGGAARTYSGLSVLDFLRRVNLVQCSRSGLRHLASPLKALARAEGLPNHYRAVEERFKS